MWSLKNDQEQWSISEGFIWFSGGFCRANVPWELGEVFRETVTKRNWWGIWCFCCQTKLSVLTCFMALGERWAKLAKCLKSPRPEEGFKSCQTKTWRQNSNVLLIWMIWWIKKKQKTERGHIWTRNQQLYVDKTVSVCKIKLRTLIWHICHIITYSLQQVPIHTGTTPGHGFTVRISTSENDRMVDSYSVE